MRQATPRLASQRRGPSQAHHCARAACLERRAHVPLWARSAFSVATVWRRNAGCRRQGCANSNGVAVTGSRLQEPAEFTTEPFGISCEPQKRARRPLGPTLGCVFDRLAKAGVKWACEASRLRAPRVLARGGGSTAAFDRCPWQRAISANGSDPLSAKNQMHSTCADNWSPCMEPLWAPPASPRSPLHKHAGAKARACHTERKMQRGKTNDMFEADYPLVCRHCQRHHKLSSMVSP